MVGLQIVERPGANLHRVLVQAMRSGELRTFVAARRGRRVTHRNPNYPGRIQWASQGGVILCEVRSPRHPGSEWRLLSALIGRLADKYAALVHSITIQFPDAAAAGRDARRRSVSSPLGKARSRARGPGKRRI